MYDVPKLVGKQIPYVNMSIINTFYSGYMETGTSAYSETQMQHFSSVCIVNTTINDRNAE